MAHLPLAVLLTQMLMTLWLAPCGREEGAAAGTSGAAAADAVSLSDEYPVEDFRTAVTEGKAEAAVAALGRRVNDLVDKSVRNRCVGVRARRNLCSPPVPTYAWGGQASLLCTVRHLSLHAQDVLFACACWVRQAHKCSIGSGDNHQSDTAQAACR